LLTHRPGNSLVAGFERLLPADVVDEIRGARWTGAKEFVSCV
jgi:hypothetical protein